jgi:four helix bundle protein
MGTIKSFEEFEVWKTAREITYRIYSLSKKKLLVGDFALRDQIRRASISIMSNIAEGYESQTENIFIRHLGIAKGSAGEVRSQLYVALDQLYITEAEFNTLADLSKKASCQISNLIQYLKDSRKSATRDVRTLKT